MTIWLTTRSRAFIRYTALAAILLVTATMHLTASAAGDADPAATDAATPLCRFGVNGNIQNFNVTPLRVGWYIDYYAGANPVHPNGTEYAPMIRVRQTGANSYTYAPSASQIQQLAANDPGMDWFVANEPDRKIYQDALEPHIYARAYRELYQKIKAADPTAKVFAGSIVQPTPLRLQYLDLVLKHYQQLYGVLMPVDGWAIHNFLLNEKEGCPTDPNDPETYTCYGAGIPPGVNASEGLRLRVADNDDFDLFRQQIERFRRWMAVRGYRNSPLYVSEYGVLYWQYDDFTLIVDEEGNTFPPSRVNAFMNSTFDYLLNTKDPQLGYPGDENRLVQRLSWYSVQDQEFNGFLFDIDKNNQRTAMGDNYANYTAAVPDQVEFYPVEVKVTPVAPLTGDGNATLTLVARVANAGHGLQAKPVAVQFYNGHPDQGGQPIGSAQTIAVSGCGEIQQAVVQWADVAPGKYTVYARVDPTNQVAEKDETNNLAQATVQFFDGHVIAPLIRRGIDFTPVQ